MHAQARIEKPASRTFQWFLNGHEVPGATSSMLTVPKRCGDAGVAPDVYKCRVVTTASQATRDYSFILLVEEKTRVCGRCYAVSCRVVCMCVRVCTHTIFVLNISEYDSWIEWDRASCSMTAAAVT